MEQQRAQAEAYKNQRSREAEQVSQARQSNEAEATARQQKQIEEQKRQKEAETKRLADERRKDELLKREREREKVKSDRLLKEQAEKLAAEQAQKEYLSQMRNSIRLVATKCPDGEGHYYATGSKPKTKGDGCIDVNFEASCPDNRIISTGIAKNFIGMSGCFGDTYQIEPKPACPIGQVKVRVVDVKPGCN